METQIFEEMIAVVRDEQQRRSSLLTDEEPDFAYDEWLFTDAPFVNELCLVLLVALWHEVERELVKLAAQAGHDGKEISGKEYEEEVQKLRKGKGWDWTTINDSLKLKSCGQYKPVEALRFLANSYKHDPWNEPDVKLLQLLKLETGAKYAALPESPGLQEGLAAFMGLGKEAAYCDIVEGFLDVASGFIAEIRSHTKVSAVRRGPTSFNPDVCAR